MRGIPELMRIVSGEVTYAVMGEVTRGWAEGMVGWVDILQ